MMEAIYEDDKVPRRVTLLIMLAVLVSFFAASALAASSFKQGTFEFSDLIGFLTFILGLLVILSQVVWWMTRNAGRTQANTEKLDSFRDSNAKLIQVLQDRLIQHIDATDKDLESMRSDTEKMFGELKAEHQRVLVKIDKQSDRLYEFMEKHIK